MRFSFSLQQLFVLAVSIVAVIIVISNGRSTCEPCQCAPGEQAVSPNSINWCLNPRRYGNDYAMAHLPPPSSLSALLGEAPIIYVGGVGEDIAPVLEILQQVPTIGTVHLFDPTPRAITYVEKLRNSSKLYSEKLQLHAVGMGAETVKKVRFYLPKNPDHVSASVINLQKTDKYFEAPIYSVRDIMQQQKHERVDMLKINVEGLETPIIEHLIGKHGVMPSVVCVTFDMLQVGGDDEVQRAEKLLESKDYVKLPLVKNHHTTFVRRCRCHGTCN